MSEEDQQRWDRRYADGGYVPRRHPSPFLLEWLDRIPVGRALDVATGAGRNALHLASAGFDVTAVDGSSVAIGMARDAAVERGLAVDWQVADLDTFDVGSHAWDLVTVFRYRDASLWPRLASALAPGGWLVVEHHLLTTADVDGPSTDDFRVRPRELLDAADGLRVVHYSEGLEPADDPTRQYALARLVACDGDPGF